MDLNTFYHDLEKNQRSTALSYLLLSLLKSADKKESSQTETTVLDQMVNVYITHLLLSIGNPQHIEQTKKFISINDTEVASMITASTDLAVKYLIYKFNADHLLTLTGIFHEPGPDKDWLGSVSIDTLIGRGKTYYGFAAAYFQQIQRKVTAITEVLKKLSEDFERYSEILQNLSHAYFNMLQTIPPKEMKEFMEQVSRISQEIKLRELQDEFLDLYSLWLKSQDRELLKKLEALAQKIRQKDPSFQFTPPTTNS